MTQIDVVDTQTWTQRVCGALEEDWGKRSKAVVNELVDITRASDETIINWFKRKCAPSGPNLVMLMRKSPRVAAVVMEFAGMEDLAERQRQIIERQERIEVAMRGEISR